MAKIILGRTNLNVEQNAFGALPIQRISLQDAVYLLQKALDGGMDYFDTARSYTDSEQKLGEAFHDRRSRALIATKTPAQDAVGFWKDLEESLRLLRTDHIDVFQFHNPAFCPMPGGEDGLYDAMAKAKKQGKVRFIGMTNHRLKVAQEAIDSGLYDTLQFPFSYLSGEQELSLVRQCKEKNIGFVAMKGLSGGLITHSAAACAWIMQHDNVLPIWGIQRERELDEFLSYIPVPPAMTPELQAIIDHDRKELTGEFCRGCGYCMPCPKGIEINTCARASLLLRRAPTSMMLSPAGQAKMAKIAECIHCNQCAKKCPYGLDTPALLRRNYQDYREILAGKQI